MRAFQLLYLSLVVVASAAANPACAGNKADGTTGAGAICSCGINNVQTAATEFCFVRADGVGYLSTAANPACASTDGLVAAGGTGCRCGTSAVLVDATEFCDTTLAATGTKMTTARCAGNKADGTTVAGVICTCGTGGLQTAAEKYCFVGADGWAQYEERGPLRRP